MSTISDLIASNNQLTSTATLAIDKVNGTIDGIKSEVTAAKTDFETFINQADARYLGALHNINLSIDATNNTDMAPQIIAAFAAGHKTVELKLAENTTAYIDQEILVPPGCGIYLTGASKDTSIVKFRRYEQQVVSSVTRHQISPFALRPGCIVRAENLSLQHEVQANTKAAPFGHGIFRITWNEFTAGNISVFCRDVRFQTYDCVVYLEGSTAAMTMINLYGCHLERVANPGWFDNPNVGWVGVGSWGMAGNAVCFNNRSFSQSADTATEFTYGFINCWLSGSDATQQNVTRTYDYSVFMGLGY